MTYREKLELYSQGKLDEQQKIEIEQDLEKQEALADYLFEHQAPPGMDDLFDEEPAFGAKATGGNDSNAKASITENDLITKQINWSIRKAFIKTGVVAVIIAIAISLFITLALPRIVSAFYYDPGKKIDLGDDDYEYQLDRDMRALIEMRIPELGGRIDGYVDGFGYGNFRYTMQSSYYLYPNPDSEDYATKSKSLTGEIRQNYFYSSDPNELQEYMIAHGDSYFVTDDYFSELTYNSDGMNHYSQYYAYVSLKKGMPYKRFYSEYADNDSFGTSGSWVWCRVQPGDGIWTSDVVGFFARSFAMNDYWPENPEAEPLIDTEEKAMKHFQQVIKDYNNIEFVKEKLEFDGIFLEECRWTEYEKHMLSKHGLNVKNFIYAGDKEHIDKLREDKNVEQIITKEIK